MAAFDSQLTWCARLRDELRRRGFGWQVVVPDARSALSRDHLGAAGFEEIRSSSWAEILSSARAADVVVSGLSGTTNESFLADLGEQRDGRTGPVLVTGWVGVIAESRTAGYLDRYEADVVAVNSRSTLAHFAGVADRLEIPSDNLLLTGQPIAAGPARPARSGAIRRVLFADQPTVPQRAEDRAYLYGRLLDYARAHPDRQVRLRPRHRLGADTLHRMRHHPESLLADVDLPPNFGISHTPVSSQLPTTDLLLTMSSTVCLEALEAGCRVALPLDLGVHEELGNRAFLGSGLLRTFDQITADDLGTPDPAWQADYEPAESAEPAAIIGDRIEQLLGSGLRPADAVRRSRHRRTGSRSSGAAVARSRRTNRGGALTGWRHRMLEVGHAVLPPRLVRPVRRLADGSGLLR